MKARTLLTFLFGCAVGAGSLWFANSRRILLVPSGGALVEVNHFTGEARAVHIWQSDAQVANYADDDRLVRLDEERTRRVASGAAPAGEEKTAAVLTPKTFKVEGESGVVTYGASLANSRSGGIQARLHNGTSKTLTRAQFRLEGMDSETGVPIARTFLLDLKVPCEPGSDALIYGEIPGGGVYTDRTRVTKLEIIQIDTKAP